MNATYVIATGLVLAVGCATNETPQRTSAAEKAHAHKHTAEPKTDRSEKIAQEPPTLRPGLDLKGPLAVAPNASEQSEIASKREITPLALGADRAFVAVDVPTPPRGGSVTFEFGDGQRGWVARVPESRQLPAAAFGDGRVYISGGFDSVNFYALDAKTGQFVWAATELEDNGPTAAIYHYDGEDGWVVFNTESCTLFVLDAETGRKRWSLWLGDPTLAQTAVADGLVYAAHPSPDGPRLSAFKLTNGTRVWSRRVAGELLAAPIIHGDSVYVTTIGGVGYRFDRLRGKRLWRARLDATTAPWIDGDELYVSRRDGDDESLVVVDSESGALLRTHHRVPGSHLRDVPRNLENWRKVWAFEGSRPVVYDGVSYTSMGSRIIAADAADGNLRWIRLYERERNKHAGDESGPRIRAGTRALGSVAIAGPHVVTASRDGRVVGLDIDTGYTLWAYDVREPIVAEPIVAQGWVYLTTKKGRVIGLQVGDTSLDGWHMFGGSPGHNGPMQKPLPRKVVSLRG